MAKVYHVPTLDNIQEVVNRVWQRAVQSSPSLLRTIRSEAWTPGSGGRHQYINRYDSPRVFEQTSSAGGVVTLTDPAGTLDYLQVGDRVRLANEPLIAQVSVVTPTNITLVVVTANGGNITAIPTGPATWEVLARSIRDASIVFDGRTAFKQDKLVWNGIETTREYVTLSQTLMDTATHDQASEIERQLENLSRLMIRNINNVLIYGATRSMSLTDADLTGRCGGIAWLQSVVPGAADADGMQVYRKATTGQLEYDDLADAIEMLADWDTTNWTLCINGQTQKYISKNWIDGVVTQVSRTTGEQVFGSYINELINPFTSQRIPVTVDWNIPPGQALLINTANTRFIDRLAPTVKGYAPGVMQGQDALTIEIMAKFTIEWLNSWQNVIGIHNLQ